jgi:hypothetical protein
VKFHRDGSVKSLPLQKQTAVKTPLGFFPAELVTFYPGGEICRVFPLNGKLSGYWKESDEYKLAESLEVPTPLGILSMRPLYLHFYETGELKSITFWPGENPVVETPLGEMAVRRGLSFFRSGALATCEPAEPVRVNTSIGWFHAFDPDPLGMNGENNSLKFDEEGRLVELATVSDEVFSRGRNFRRFFRPEKKISLCSDRVFVLKPMRVRFNKDSLEFFSDRESLGTFSKELIFRSGEMETHQSAQVETCPETLKTVG